MTTMAVAWTFVASAAASSQVVPTRVPEPVVKAPPAVTDAAARAAIKPFRSHNIVLVGDLTTQVSSGWGGAFCADHVTSVIACVNLARGGRSTYDYKAEGSWALALREAAPVGYESVHVLIGFGHNDRPGHAGRSTDLADEFPANLRRYVEDVRRIGATPVLVTPVTNRAFVGGSLQDDLASRANAIRAVARAMNVRLIDLHARSMKMVQAMGPVAALSLAELPPPPEIVEAARRGTTIELPASRRPTPPATDSDRPQSHPWMIFDYTHLGPKGAALFSRIVAVELARAAPELRRELVEDVFGQYPNAVEQR